MCVEIILDLRFAYSSIFIVEQQKLPPPSPPKLEVMHTSRSSLLGTSRVPFHPMENSSRSITTNSSNNSGQEEWTSRCCSDSKD